MKRVNIPLYKTHFFVTPYPSEVMHSSYRLTGYEVASDEFDGCNAMVIYGNDTNIVWMPSTATPDTVAHEAAHVAFNIMRMKGIKPDLNNQEPMTYLIGFIAGAITKIKAKI